MRLGIDLDGPVVHSTPYWTERFSQHFQRHFPMEEIALGIHLKPDLLAYFDQHEGDLYWQPPPTTGAPEGLQRLKAKGRELHYISARTPRVQALTQKWLTQHGIPFDSLHLLEGGNKALHCEKLGIELMIEDSPHHAVAIAQTGVPVLLFDTPYNGQVDHPLVTRCHSWDDILRAL